MFIFVFGARHPSSKLSGANPRSELKQKKLVKCDTVVDTQYQPLHDDPIANGGRVLSLIKYFNKKKKERERERVGVGVIKKTYEKMEQLFLRRRRACVAVVGASGLLFASHTFHRSIFFVWTSSHSLPVHCCLWDAVNAMTNGGSLSSIKHRPSD